jgi:hypothetical protein
MARRVIALLGGPPVTLDGDNPVAGEAIIPGHLLMDNGTSIVKNTANGANVARMFALERDELGTDIDTAYASGDQVKVGVFRGGQRVYAWLASGQNVARGAYLSCDNAGLLTLASVSSTVRIARAVEAVNTAGSAPVAGTRIRVEIV